MYQTSQKTTAMRSLYLLLNLTCLRYKRGTKGLEDLTFYAGRDEVLRQELRYVNQIVGELQKRMNDLLYMLPRE
jgi:hypothetical protein